MRHSVKGAPERWHGALKARHQSAIQVLAYRSPLTTLLISLSDSLHEAVLTCEDDLAHSLGPHASARIR
jgi:hypothetical protein